MATMLARTEHPHEGGGLFDATIRVLLLFDSEAQVLAIRDVMSASRRESYLVEWGEPHDAGPDLLRESTHDVCLVSGDSRDGHLRLLRATEGVARRPPIVILTADCDADADAAAMAAGATECLEWSLVDTDRVDRTLRYAVERHRLVRHLGDALIQVAALRRSLSRMAPEPGVG